MHDDQFTINNNNKHGSRITMTTTACSNNNNNTLVLIPLPLNVMEQLKRIQNQVNKKRNEYIPKKQQQDSPIQTAIAILQLIFQKYKIAQTQTSLVEACMMNAVVVRDEETVENVGLDKRQVLLSFQNMRIVVLDLEEAVFRADLFSSQQQALAELLYSSCQTAATQTDTIITETQEEWVHHVPKKSSKKTTTPNNKSKTTTTSTTTTTTNKTKTSPLSIQSKHKHAPPCMNGAECRNILNGTCPYYHSPQEVYKAGAIIEEVIGISPNKVGYIIGTNGELVETMKQQSGADIWIDASINKNGVRLLHVLGNRDSVQKGIHLVMTSAARCKNQTIAHVDHVQALVGMSYEKQRLLLSTSTTTLEEIMSKSGAEIIVDPSQCSLQVVGTKQEVEHGIELVMQWAATLDDDQGGMKKMPTKPTTITGDLLVSESGTTASASTNTTSAKASIAVPSAKEVSWPSLAPQAVSANYYKKPMTMQSTKAKPKKKKNTDVCIHGASCRYIRNGIDNCEFYHSAKELELAAAAAKKSSSSEADHFLYVPRAAMGHIIGRNGSTVNEIIQSSGAEIENDPVKNGDGKTRIVHIYGTPKAVTAALEMILKRIPKGFKVESGPGKSTSTVSAVVAPKPTAPSPPARAEIPRTNVVSPTPAPPANRPSPVTVTPIASPTIPIVDGPSNQTALSSHSVASSSSGSATLVSNLMARSSNASLTAIDDHAVITGETIPTQTLNRFTASPFQEKRVPVSPSATDVTSSSLFPSVSSQSLVSDPSSLSIGASPIGAVMSSSDCGSLLAFLTDQAVCLKGSPQEFCEWLASEDIVSLVDLAEAVVDDGYFREVLQQGDGTNGIKGFKRNAFKKAILGAAAASEASATLDEADTNVKTSSNEEPLAELMCPISHVLMVEDPVIAADGYTYERAAIEAWFYKQYCEVMAAKQQMATVGADSQHARNIIERGVLSPMTHESMPHLNLTPNHTLRTMAKDAASSMS